MINKSGKGAALKFEQYLDPFTMLLLEGHYETMLFKDLPNHVFQSP